MAVTIENSGHAIAPNRYWRLAPWIASAGLIVWWLVMGGRYSLWTDEAFSVRQSRLPLSELITEVVRDEGNMGPYYILLWIWEKVFPGPQWARALSVLASISSIWLIWTLMKVRTEVRIAAACVMVLASSPFFLKWTIQARGFTFVVALSALSLLLAQELAKRPSSKLAVLLGVATGISTATLLSSFFLYAGLFLLLALSRPWRQMMRWLVLAGGVATACFAPFAWAFARNRNQVRWIPETDLGVVAAQTTDFLGGPVFAVIHAAGAFLLIAAIVRRRISSQFSSVIWLLAGSFGGLLVTSLLVQPLFVSRYLSAALPLVAISLAGSSGVVNERAKGIYLSALCALCLAVTMIWPRQALPTIEDYRWALEKIESLASDGDAVTSLPTWNLYSLEINWGRQPSGTNLVVVNEDGALHVAGDGTLQMSPERLWIVARGRIPRGDELGGTGFERVFDQYSVTLASFEKKPLLILLLGRSEFSSP